MKLIYNAFDLATVFARGRLQIVTSQQYGPKGDATIGTETWIHTGYVRANETGSHDLAALVVNMNALKAAFSVNGGSLQWATDAGTVCHELTNGSTTNKTRVVRFEWLPGNPTSAELTARRSYRVIISGNRKITGDGLLAYHETVDYIGTGGPRVVWRPSFVGIPQPQVTILETPVLVIQSGRAVGLSSYPLVPGLLFAPQFLQSEPTHPITYDSPPEFGNSPVGWGVRWRYVFQGRQADLNGATPLLP